MPEAAAEVFIGGLDMSGRDVYSGGFHVYAPSHEWEDVESTAGTETVPTDAVPFGISGTTWSEGLTAYAGIVMDPITQVRLRLTWGEVRDMELIPGPPGVDARYFVIWTPVAAEGRFLLMDEDGTVLYGWALCSTEVPPKGHQITCNGT